MKGSYLWPPSLIISGSPCTHTNAYYIIYSFAIPTLCHYPNGQENDGFLAPHCLKHWLEAHNYPYFDPYLRPDVNLRPSSRLPSLGPPAAVHRVWPVLWWPPSPGRSPPKSESPWCPRPPAQRRPTSKRPPSTPGSRMGFMVVNDGGL